jgi:hypothetical protein
MATDEKQPREDPEREARIQRILREVEKQLRERLPNPRQPLEKTEREIVEIGREVREVIERETLADAGTGYLGSHALCACGCLARYVKLNGRHLVTLNGTPQFARAYYHCAVCRRGFCPLDGELGIGRRHSSVGVRALTGRFTSYMGFGKAAEELELVTGVRLSKSTVWREGIAVGQAFVEEWRERERQLWAGCAPAPRERFAQLQISMDGVSLHVGGDWREAKIGVIYQTGEPGQVTRALYGATLRRADGFGRRLRTMGQVMGVSYCRRSGVVADGADWIWQLAAKYFTRSEEILDCYHALQHLWEVARARYGEGPAAREWIDQQVQWLLDDKVGRVIRAVASWKTQTAEEGEVKRKVGNYLRENEHRMAYKTLRAAGFHIGSGVVEAGAKSVVQARLKGAGMRWSERGAEAVLHLRAAWCSTGETDFLGAARRATFSSQS